MSTTAKIQGKNLVITTPLIEPRSTGSGKNLLIASTGAFVETDATLNGKKVRVSINAIIKP
jgi:hypothetical protein